MTQELVFRESKLDWIKVINLALNKKDWGKTYLLYSYGNATVDCIMKNYDFERDVAIFKIRCCYINNDGKYRNRDSRV